MVKEVTTQDQGGAYFRFGEDYIRILQLLRPLFFQDT